MPGGITFFCAYYVFCFNAYLFQFQVARVHKLPKDQDQDARYAAKLKAAKELENINLDHSYKKQVKQYQQRNQKGVVTFPLITGMVVF